jgi:hypothetical protein
MAYGLLGMTGSSLGSIFSSFFLYFSISYRNREGKYPETQIFFQIEGQNFFLPFSIPWRPSPLAKINRKMTGFAGSAGFALILKDFFQKDLGLNTQTCRKSLKNNG